MKRGQITIFVIVGVLLISSALLLFYFISSFNSESVSDVRSDNVYNLIISCLEEVGNDAILRVLFQGGTYITSDSENIHFYKLAKPIFGSDPKAIEKNEDYEFSREGIKESLEDYLDDYLEGCISDIDFDRFDEEITLGNLSNEVEVEDKFILMNLDLPVTVTKGEETSIINNFKYIRNLNIKEMEEIVNRIVNESVEDNAYPIDLVHELEERDDIGIDINFAFEDDAIEHLIYTVNFKEDGIFVNFNIHYYWYGR